MTHRFYLGRTPLILTVAVLSLSLLSGCGIFKKRQANAKIEEAQQALDSVRSQGADKYLPQLFTQASQLLGSAQGGVQNGTYDEALANAESALGVVSQIQSQVGAKRQEIEGKKAQLIELQTQIVDTVERVKTIGPERTDVIEGSVELDGFIQQVQASQVQVSEGEMGYDAALARASAFLSGATQALSELEVTKSRELLRAAEDAWTSAVSVEVEKYVEASQNVRDTLQLVQTMIDSGKGREVLEQYSTLPQQIAGFEDEAREKRAVAQIDRAQRLIEIAESEPDASLDGIESAKGALEEAREALQEGSYANAYNAAGRSLEAARAEVQFLESDLNGQAEQLAARLEESLKWETPKLAKEAYDEALSLLETARDHLTEIRFADAQTAIDQGSLRAEEAIAAAREIGLNERVAKEEANLQATQEIGAFTYLRDDYQAIQNLLADAKVQISRTAFDEAELTLDDVAQRIAGLEAGLQSLAQTELASAEASYQEAVEAESERFAQDLLADTSTTMDDARAAAAQSRWKDALEAAAKARDLANQASAQSYRLRTEELESEAEAELGRASASGSASYAADVYNRALAAKEYSTVAYSNGDYKEALTQLTEAQTLAVQARNQAIEEAQAAVDSAIEAKANDFEQELLGGALASLADARDKMAEESYEASLAAARKALESAKSAEQKTWQERARASIESLTAQVARSEASRGPSYAQEEHRTAAQTLKSANQSFANGAFKEAYMASDRGLQEAEQVFARLRDEARLVRGNYDGQVGLLKTFVEEETGRAFLQEATLRLGLIDEAILNDDLGEVFRLYEEGDRAVTSQIQAIKVININNKIASLNERIRQSQADGLFQFVETSADEFLRRVAEIEYDPELDRLKPNQDYYVEAQRNLARQESELDRLRERAIGNIETRIQRVRTDIDNAREIGARDLVQGVFDTAVDRYERTRDLLYVIRNDLSTSQSTSLVELGNQLTEAEAQAATLNSTVISQRNSVDYLRDIILWTYDMTRYLDQWYPVEELGYQMIMTSAPTAQVDTYRQMQQGISAANLLKEAQRLHQRVTPITPPPDQAQIHQLAVQSFTTFLSSAEGFYRFGQYSRYPKQQRESFLGMAFTSLEELHRQNERLMVAILRQVQAYNLVEFERDLADEFKAFKTYLRRDKTSK